MKPIMYVKPGCPWCKLARDFFSDRGVDLEERDVISDKAAWTRMEEISGQTKTPTFEYGDFVVADFDPDEFMAAVDKKPEIKKALGL